MKFGLVLLIIGISTSYCLACGPRRLRLAVFLDSSGSLEPTELAQLKRFVQKLSLYFRIGPEHAAVALGQFAANASVTLGFDHPASHTRGAFERVLRNVEHIGGMTNIYNALVKGEEVFKKLRSAPHEHHRLKKVLLMVTDGIATLDSPPYQPILQDLKKSGVRVIPVGARGAGIAEEPNYMELAAIASGKMANVYFTDGMRNLVKTIREGDVN